MGDLVAGIVVTPDADNVWVGGSDGLAKLNQGRQWERYAAGTTVTALVHDGGSGVWIGNEWQRHHARRQGDMLQFGMAEGNDIDNVRAMVADNTGSLLAVGDGPGGQRIAFYDGTRFGPIASTAQTSSNGSSASAVNCILARVSRYGR